ncbi:MAG: molybdenum cofactor guanylyltransferase [Gemmatimonadales bacterium]
MRRDLPAPRGAIIAGGEASRFQGRPKGLEQVGGTRILDRLVASFLPALGTLPLLVANDSQAGTWRPDLEVAADLRPGYGALGGIHSAVRHGTAPVVCIAWDMPFVPPELIRLLADGLAAGYDAFLPESGGPRGLEPLCAAYGPACGPAIEARLQAGDLRAIGFHADLKVGILSLDRVRRLGDPDYLFFNVNTADDLAKADELWRRHESSR